jgi:hypothetical protein
MTRAGRDAQRLRRSTFYWRLVKNRVGIESIPSKYGTGTEARLCCFQYLWMGVISFKCGWEWILPPEIGLRLACRATRGNPPEASVRGPSPAAPLPRVSSSKNSNSSRQGSSRRGHVSIFNICPESLQKTLGKSWLAAIEPLCPVGQNLRTYGWRSAKHLGARHSIKVSAPAEFDANVEY